MKKSTHDNTLAPEKQHYKKKYIVRKLEEKEAEKEIHIYEDRESSKSSPNRDINRPT